MFYSPLRYPGGKRKLANFLKLVIEWNNLLDGEYVEPYAGGSSIALILLFEEYVQNVWINDLDKSIYAFWYSAINCTDKLCQLIKETNISINEWEKQKAIQSDLSADLLTLGFSTFFLNRTNRSGILSGGIIGGKHQSGDWKLDARYNKQDLISRIEKIARYRNRINLSNLDAVQLITGLADKLPHRSLIYFDPPYYVKGQQLLYKNYYKADDHRQVSEVISGLKVPWIVSYDNAEDIRKLYQSYRFKEYSLRYSAQDRYEGAEIMFFSHNLIIRDVENPTKIKMERVLPLFQGMNFT